jgi:hypothetical protein
MVHVHVNDFSLFESVQNVPIHLKQHLLLHHYYWWEVRVQGAWFNAVQGGPKFTNSGKWLAYM